METRVNAGRRFHMGFVVDKVAVESILGAIAKLPKDTIFVISVVCPFVHLSHVEQFVFRCTNFREMLYLELLLKSLVKN
jgi:hypothetical protein